MEFTSCSLILEATILILKLDKVFLQLPKEWNFWLSVTASPYILFILVSVCLEQVAALICHS